MKKRILASILCITLAASMVACGSDKNTDGTETASAVVSSDKRSGEFEIDVTKQVTNLADYKSIPVTLAASYEVTEDAVNAYLANVLTTFGGDAYKEVTDRDVVEEGDYVKVNYTGYLDGEAFDGGAATDVLLDVSNNRAVGGSGFIDGFTAGIIGGKVGETVSSDVTFPDEYQAENLAGQLATFEFDIIAIYSTETVTIDELTDEQVEEYFSAAGVTTVADLRTAIESDLEQNAYSQTVSAVKSYMLENSTVEVPEDYLQARVSEYITSFEKDNVTDDQTLEDYLMNNYGVTYDEAVETWTTSLTEQIKTEFVFGYVAELEGIEVDEDSYQNYVSYIISQAGGTFEDETAVYDYFGSGNAEEGEAYLRNQYRVNKAIDLVAESAEVTYESAEANEDVEATESVESTEE